MSEFGDHTVLPVNAVSNVQYDEPSYFDYRLNQLSQRFHMKPARMKSITPDRIDSIFRRCSCASRRYRQ